MTSTLWTFLYWGWVASEVAILLVTRTRRSTGNVKDRGSLLLLWLTIAASITAAEWLRYTVSAGQLPPASWLWAASVILLATGLLIRWTAVITLGRSFSANVAIHGSQTVHQTGLFHFVRHPSYLGLLLIFLAIGVHSRNWISLLLIVVPTTAALLYRIHVEEHALREAFGAEYESYSQKTSRLIPGIY